MSSGTRAAVARAAIAAADVASTSAAAPEDDHAQASQISLIEAQLLLLTGKSNASERNRLNKQLWYLQQGQQPQPSSSTFAPSQIATAECQRVADHWQVLRPQAPRGVPSCVRCGDGTAAVCQFHPDAKAWAFGSGRFDYAYTSLWDTPHDGWMCCVDGNPAAAGCMCEATHTVDAEWWRAYTHLAPAMPADREEGMSSSSSSSEGEEDADDADERERATVALEAMDIS